MLLLFLIAIQTDHARFIETKMTYEPIPESEEAYLEVPFSIAFHQNGDLYVLDSRTCRIHVWNRQGKYLRHFGKTGSGPGEMAHPAKIDIDQNSVWVFDHSGRRLSQFNLEGDFLHAIVPEIRAYNFAVLPNTGFLIGYKRHAKDGTRASFKLLDAHGKEIKTLLEISHQGYLTKTSEDKQAIKAFGPEMVIQKASPETWLIGFSQTTKLMEVDASGNILGEHVFDHQVDKPTKAETQFHQQLHFVNLDGRETAFKDMTRLTFSYDYDKANYTHFTKMPDGKIVFATTPLGGFIRAAGFYRASFSVADWQTKKMEHKGFYNFSKGSHVYFENGRLIAFELDESGDFRISQLKLKGR